MQELFLKDNITEEISKYNLKNCSYCLNEELIEWPFPPKSSYILGLLGIREVKITVKVCPTCKRGYYPDLYDKGLIPIHSKFLLRFVYIKSTSSRTL